VFLNRLTISLTPPVAKLVSETVQSLKRKSILERTEELERQLNQEDEDEDEDDETDDTEAEDGKEHQNGSAQNQVRSSTQNDATETKPTEKFVVSSLNFR
jgi:hypothetical protein